MSTVDNFTNDSAMMIAWERALETKREDALFKDPFAEALAGSKGERLSEDFGNMCKMFELEDWTEFHKTWVAVRTRFIDDRIAEYTASGAFTQLANVGAGMDTRSYRMECYSAFKDGAFAVDMEIVQSSKAKLFAEFLGSPTPKCKVVNVSLDLLDEERTLKQELANAGFNSSKPSVFVSEGLVMYLGPAGKLKLLKDVSAAAAPGSVFVLQFMDASESEVAKTNPATLEPALSIEEATRTLTAHGWEKLEFSRFGDDKLNFGRFPSDRFKPQAGFSFCVCTKAG